MNYNTKLIYDLLKRFNDLQPPLKLFRITSDGFYETQVYTIEFITYLPNNNPEEKESDKFTEQLYDETLKLTGVKRVGNYRQAIFPHEITLSVNIDNNDVDWKFLNKEFNWGFKDENNTC